MAFLAKQFTSLLLLLTISRLILSTHAVRQHFSQFGRMTTTTAATTDSTDKKPDFSQPAFYQNVGERNGFGTSPPPPSFRPLNYDSKMYTTSRETQKNVYDNNVQTNDAPSKEENYGAYNPFSNSKYDEQYDANKKKPTTTTESKKQTEESNEFYYKDTSSNVYNNQQTQSSKPFSSSSKFNRGYNQNNQFYQKDPYNFPQEEDESAKARNYDPFSSTKSSPQYNENNKEQKYPTTVPVNQFYQHNNQFQQQVNEPYEAKKYDPYGSQQYIEAEEEKEKKPTTTTVSENQYGYKYNPFQQANYDPTESKKQSNSKYDEQYTTVAEKYANEDAELDAFLNEQENKQVAPTTPSYKFSKNSVPAQSYGNTKKDTNNEWSAYYQKKDDDKHFAMTDDELNAILDEEEKQGEDEIGSPPHKPETPPQGMSDTRAENNQQYYQPYKWQEHPEDFANAFTGNALTNALQNNP